MGEFTIRTIGAGSCHLDRVKELGRANKATLGFFPDGAFEEYAKRKLIGVAIETATARCVGYILYRTGGVKATIAHLCVDAEFRGRGVAKDLFVHVRELTKNLQGISLKCRRDRPENSMWPRLGFHSQGNILGRSLEGHELTCWWFDHGHRTLFSEAEGEGDAKTVIDTNVFLDLHASTSEDAEESKCLQADWLSEVSLCITDEVLNEVQRNDDRAERTRLQQVAERYIRLRWAHDRYDAAYARLRSILPPPDKPSDESDLRHIAKSVAGGAQYFVTRDEILLKHSDKVCEQFGMEILRPSTLVTRLDEIVDESRYHPARLAGSSLALRRARGDEEEPLWSSFQSASSGERRAEFLRSVRVCIADLGGHECWVVSGDDDCLLALFAIAWVDPDTAHAPLMRVAESPLANTLARHLVSHILERVSGLRRKYLYVKDPHLPERVRQALWEDAFVEGPEGWVKLVHRFAGSFHEFVVSVGALLRSLPSAYSQGGRHALAVADRDLDARSAAELERLYWPAKITDAPIPSFVVPVKPSWAEHLFDRNLAGQTLLGASLTPALLRECVYFRRPGWHGGIAAPARILWYVTKRRGVPGSGAIRAYSSLYDVTRGPAHDLYRRFRRYGIYRWSDVLALAGDDPSREIMTLHFRDTEQFAHPIQWGAELGRAMGRSDPPQSPTRVRGGVFRMLYERGTGEMD